MRLERHGWADNYLSVSVGVPHLWCHLWHIYLHQHLYLSIILYIHISIFDFVHVCNYQYVFLLHASCRDEENQGSRVAVCDYTVEGKDECVALRCMTVPHFWTWTHSARSGGKYRLTVGKPHSQHLLSEVKEEGWIRTTLLLENRREWKCTNAGFTTVYFTALLLQGVYTNTYISCM